MMERDPRYDIVKLMLEKGRIQELYEIQHYVPKTVLASDMRVHIYTMTKMLRQPEQYPMTQLAFLASLIGVQPRVILELAVKGYVERLDTALNK